MSPRLLVLLSLIAVLLSCARAPRPAMEPSADVAVVGEEAQPLPKEHPFLWIIERETPSYLYGTIHLPDPRVTNLPPVVEQAIEACDELNTEIPMDMFTIGRVAFAMIAPADQRLNVVLPEDLYNRAERILQSYGQSMSTYNTFKVWGLLAILPQLDYVARGQTEALDQKLYRLAVTKGKRVGGIETVGEQLSVFEQMPREDLIHLLRLTIEQIEKSKEEDADSPTEKLLRGYLTGDMDTVVEYVQEEHDEDDPVQQRFMQKLLVDRNHKMADRIHQRLSANPDRSYFFAIGLMHFPLEDGLLELLEAQGHTIRRHEPGGELPLPPAREGEAEVPEEVLIEG